MSWLEVKGSTRKNAFLRAGFQAVAIHMAALGALLLSGAGSGGSPPAGQAAPVLMTITHAGARLPNPATEKSLHPKIVRVEKLAVAAHTVSPAQSDRKISSLLTPTQLSPAGQVAETQSGDHGPIATYRPLPEIPSELRSDRIARTVLIEFAIGSDASFHTSLVASCGNEQLDRLALETAQKWKFEAAVELGHAAPSRIRLKISFRVV